MYEVKKRFEISAAHKLDLDYDSKCTNFHGHNWIIDVHLQSETLDKNRVWFLILHTSNAKFKTSLTTRLLMKLYRSILLPKTWRNTFAMSLHRSVIVLTYRKVRTTLQATSKMMLK